MTTEEGAIQGSQEQKRTPGFGASWAETEAEPRRMVHARGIYLPECLVKYNGLSFNLNDTALMMYSLPQRLTPGQKIHFYNVVSHHEQTVPLWLTEDVYILRTYTYQEWNALISLQYRLGNTMTMAWIGRQHIDDALFKQASNEIVKQEKFRKCFTGF